MDSPDPPTKKIKAIQEKPDVCEPVTHAKIVGLVIPMVRETDTTSTFSHWVDDKTMFFKSNRSRACPLGHVHKSNSFHVKIDDDKVYIARSHPRAARASDSTSGPCPHHGTCLEMSTYFSNSMADPA